MLLRSLAVSLGLILADWGVWEWALANDHATIALIAGLAMAPLVVLLAWYALLGAAALARIAVDRATGQMRSRGVEPAFVTRVHAEQPDEELESERLAA
jgi:hypothetical protein